MDLFQFMCLTCTVVLAPDEVSIATKRKEREKPTGISNDNDVTVNRAISPVAGTNAVCRSVAGKSKIQKIRPPPL